MQKKDFVTLILSTVGGILFALGMCMALLPEWNAFMEGIVVGAVGLVVLLIMAVSYTHLLLAIGRPHEVAHGSLRLTLSEETSEADIDYTIKAVKEVVTYLRSISPVWRDLENGVKQYVIQ